MVSGDHFKEIEFSALQITHVAQKKEAYSFSNTWWWGFFLASLLNIHFPFWVLYFTSRAGQSWLSTTSCIRSGIACTRFLWWQFSLAHINLSILFFFCICEIPFFKWLWKIIPLTVPSPQVDKSYSGKLSLTMTTRSKGLQQKDYLWICEASLVL